jgi:hypothetical protein
MSEEEKAKASAASDAIKEAAKGEDFLAQIRGLDEYQARDALCFLHGWMRKSGDLEGMRQALESVEAPHSLLRDIFVDRRPAAERIADALDELIAAVREHK